MCLKITDANTNVIFGFAWKTDLIGLTREFPYRERDIIIESSNILNLPKFTEVETNILLDRLSEELHSKLRKDLRFLLSEFSQGYPWLLKKLCAHVKNQRESGVLQAEIARSLLNVEELFNSDLSGLSSEEEHSLKHIAKLAPVSFSDLGDDCNPNIIHSLIHRRLIVKVGAKYDIYWDIFRDFLNTGNVPIQEHYMLRAQVGSVLNAISILRKFNSELLINEFQQQAGITSENSFYNIARDMHILELAKVIDSKVCLTLKNNISEDKFDNYLREHLRERLKRNQVVKIIIDELNETNELNLGNISDILRKSFGYISANIKTWYTYARVLMSWLDIADIAILDQNNKKLLAYKSSSEIRDRKLIFISKRVKANYPRIQFQPVYEVASRITQAVSKKDYLDWSGISKSTLYKALATLEDLNLITKKAKSIVVNIELFDFVKIKEFRITFTRNAVLKMEVFKEFLQLLEQYKTVHISQKMLGSELRKRLNLNWAKSTAEVNIKIMMDWARHLELAPGKFSITYRGKFKKENLQNVLNLFFNN